MARPRKNILKVGKKLDGRIWRLRWGRAPDTVSFSLGHLSDDPIISEELAERKRMEIQNALANGKWPAWAMQVSQVREYANRDKIAGRQREYGNLLADYAVHLEQNVSRDWCRASLAHLRELRGFAATRGEDGFETITPATAQAWINSIPGSECPFLTKRKPRSRATANRARAACSAFYRWPGCSGIENPFAGIRQLQEADPEEIVFLTVDERARVLTAAEQEPDGIAVWIALYTGMRRSEVAKLEWDDTNLTTRKITVRRGKTPKRKRKNRVVEIAEPLFKKLSKTMPAKRIGRVLPWSLEEYQWREQAENLVARIRKRFADQADKTKGKREKKALAAIAEKVKWNVFRHTFCSLHAQAGTKPFKIIKWTGHSLEVFMRHYGAQVAEYDDDINAVEKGQARQPKGRGRKLG